DTRPNAFLASDNPALVYREKVQEQFGLSDPLIIALVDRGPKGIFHPTSLALLQSLSDQIGALPNIDEERVMSLASEKNIVASEEGMEVSGFLDQLPENQVQAEAVRAAVFDFPLLVGNLVSRDGHVTLIVAELLDDREVESTYTQVKAIADRMSASGDVEIHVAGEGAIAGYLAKYIDIDAKQLNPLAWAVIMLILYIAYRRFSPPLIANVIIAASVLIPLGIMAAAHIPFYMITSALPVILIGISVADTIHIYSQYYELQARDPDAEVRDLVAATMRDMWRPVTLTTLTTMAGFLGLYFSAYMPPFKYFGLFAAIGVAVAWLYSMVLLPATIVLFKPQVSPGFQRQVEAAGSDWFGRCMQALGRLTQAYATPLLVTALAVMILGTIAASQIIVDEEPIAIFHSSEPLYQADKVMNTHLAGTNALDVVIEASEPGGLLQPDNLARIEALQAYAVGLPHVGGSTSIVDYLKQMNRALRGGSVEDYVLPDSEDLVAQYFLIYSATSDSSDFEEEIDYDYQMANVRLNLNTGSYHKFKPVVESMQRYIDEEFNTPELKATLSGRVNLNYHWIGDLGRSHFAGLGFALLLVWVVSTLLFRSAWAGVYTLVPVAGAILLVYAAMVVMNLGLGVGTSMFAAVALGLGVDFSIHTLERFRVLYASENGDWNRVFDEFYKTTGRALFFNFLAIACGFGVLISSKVASLNNFGLMIVIAITTSFLASMTILPAMIRTFRPNFITTYGDGAVRRPIHWPTLLIVAAALLVAWFLFPPVAAAQEPKEPAAIQVLQPENPVQLSAADLVLRVNAVDNGEFVTRKLSMQLVNRRGKERLRDTVVYRKYYGEEMRTIVFYESPANVRNTSFLTWDYPEVDRDDDQWLYLPALRKVRRISAADRGDYFMGTDFTYEDIKLDGKLSENDYEYTLLQTPDNSPDGHYKLEATPRDDETAQELGYSRINFWVNPSNWLVIKGEFTDIKGNLLKTLHVTESAQIDDIWTRQRIEMENHKSGHRTIFSFSDIDYTTPVNDTLFSKRAMERGAP
ncbi:MAG: Patched family protein, partial [Gammaproteobacteria bacterium]